MMKLVDGVEGENSENIGKVESVGGNSKNLEKIAHKISGITERQLDVSAAAF